MAPDVSIFKAYDIRGIVDKTLTEDAVRQIGRVLGTMAHEAGRTSFCVGRDGRLSGERLAGALMEGITSAGVDVIDIGMVPTPVLYFATVHFGNGTGVAVTGSHNPPEYNGLKMMIGGITLFADQIQDILARIRNEDWCTAEVPGTIRREDVVPAYLERVLSDVRLERPMRIAIDAGNGVAGPVAARLFKSLGCEVTELFTDVDGTFPNHHPDPSKPANLEDLKKAVLEDGIELGLAFDGDGDRLGVVTKSGEIIYPDRQMMLFAKDILAHHPGAQIVYDVKCTRRLVPWIEACGGVPTISCTGHSLVKAKLRETALRSRARCRAISSSTTAAGPALTTAFMPAPASLKSFPARRIRPPRLKRSRAPSTRPNCRSAWPKARTRPSSPACRRRPALTTRLT